MIKSIDDKVKIRYSKLTLKWCESFFGPNERKRTKLKLTFSNRRRKIKNHLVFGNYCFWRNEMTIYLSHCKTELDIVSTIIHEYTHYLQSRVKYLKYQKEYYYSTNPYEREAKRNEERYGKLCLKEIKDRL